MSIFETEVIRITSVSNLSFIRVSIFCIALCADTCNKSTNSFNTQHLLKISQRKLVEYIDIQNAKSYVPKERLIMVKFETDVYKNFNVFIKLHPAAFSLTRIVDKFIMLQTGC